LGKLLNFCGGYGLDNTREESETQKARVLAEIVSTRKSQKVTQQKLGALTGLQQASIARLERGDTDPKLSSLLRILKPLGKTLAVVDIGQEERETSKIE
jgi:transcriptional regulator with XRE-family HTH domain